MYEVLHRDENLADAIIRDESDRGFAAVLIGNNTGRVWVDNLDNPVSALVWSDGLQCFQFMGCAANQIFNSNLRSFVNNNIIDFLKDKDLNFFEYASDAAEWYPIISDALSDRVLHESWQYVYRSKTDSPMDTEAVLSEPYCLHQIDKGFISSLNGGNIVSNPEFIIDYIHQFWGLADNYLALGNGYAAVRDDEIAGFAITDFLYEKTASIGVQTREQHRRKGLAGALVKTLLKTLHENGYNIWWDCMESNLASRKTAERAGLGFDHKYKLCWFYF